MEHIKAVAVKHGDIAYEVEIFPEYKVQMILWEGDDEFPPSSQILFSDNFPCFFSGRGYGCYGRCDHWFSESISEMRSEMTNDIRIIEVAG